MVYIEAVTRRAGEDSQDNGEVAVDGSYEVREGHGDND